MHIDIEGDEDDSKSLAIRFSQSMVDDIFNIIVPLHVKYHGTEQFLKNIQNKKDCEMFINDLHFDLRNDILFISLDGGIQFIGAAIKMNKQIHAAFYELVWYLKEYCD